MGQKDNNALKDKSIKDYLSEAYFFSDIIQQAKGPNDCEILIKKFEVLLRRIWTLNAESKILKENEGKKIKNDNQVTNFDSLIFKDTEIIDLVEKLKGENDKKFLMRNLFFLMRANCNSPFYLRDLQVLVNLDL